MIGIKFHVKLQLLILYLTYHELGGYVYCFSEKLYHFKLESMKDWIMFDSIWLFVALISSIIFMQLKHYTFLCRWSSFLMVLLVEGCASNIQLIEAEAALYWRTLCRHLQNEAQVRTLILHLSSLSNIVLHYSNIIH